VTGIAGAAKVGASEIDFGMISTGWCALINEYVGSMSGRPDGSMQHVYNTEEICPGTEPDTPKSHFVTLT
jgi:hypothetical protein